MAAPVSHRPCAHAGTVSGRSPNPLSAEARCTKAFLREEGGPRSGGRSPRDFQLAWILLSRALPQSPTATAPSRREPFISSLRQKNTTKEIYLVVFVFSPLKMQRRSSVLFYTLFVIFNRIFFSFRRLFRTNTNLRSTSLLHKEDLPA